MTVRLLEPYNGQPANSLYAGSDEQILLATGNADGRIELATGYNSMATPSTSAPLTGTSTGEQVVGPFRPQLGYGINLTLSNVNGGTVQLLRSYDGTLDNAKPITVLGTVIGTYTDDAQDNGIIEETEANAAYFLSLPASGIFYRISQ